MAKLKLTREPHWRWPRKTVYRWGPYLLDKKVWSVPAGEVTWIVYFGRTEVGEVDTLADFREHTPDEVVSIFPPPAQP